LDSQTAGPAAPVLAPKVRDLFFDADGNWIPSDYKAMYGGRGGLKSWGFARVAVLIALKRPLRIACAREYQTSIKESVHQTIVAQIEALNLEPYFNVNDRAITCRLTRTRFFFAGIKTEPAKFKSSEGIHILWIEEGERVSEESWRYITPTVFRNRGAEIWCSFNPDLEKDPTSQRFLVDPVPNARIVETNWRDNPWLPPAMIADKDRLARVDPDAYQHVWEGKFRRNSAAQILKGKYVVQAFEVPLKPKDPAKPDGPKVPAWDGPYFGADWGFSQDPTTLVKCWINGARLYIEHEAYAIGRDIDATPALFDQVPGARDHTIRGDNARPETISYLQRHGYPRLQGVEKWKGSVEDGIAHLRQYEQIVIHQRCPHSAEEALLYSYKIDKLTGDVLPDVVDEHNHIWDAVRYALQPLIRNVNTGLLLYYEQEVRAMQARKQQQQ